MKFSLKDQELQKKIDEISRGEFSKRLDECAKLNGITGVFEVRFNICGVYVEERQEYNPHAWNNYPEVEPPIGIWMKCKRFLPGDEADRRCMMFINNGCGPHWIDCDGTEWPCDSFRPWED